MKTHRIITKVLLLVAVSCTAFAFDDHHFYRASYLFDEPRLEKNGLTTWQAWIAGGSTTKGRNSDDTIVPIFDIYGFQNMHLLGSGVPCKDLTNPADLALVNLARLPANGCFAQFSLLGKFTAIEAITNFYQNLACGFFMQLQVPFRSLKVSNTRFVDLSPASSECCPNRSTVEWQDFLNNFNAILARYNLGFCNTTNTGIGDTTVLFGWTNNYQKTEVLDYIDVSYKGGILIPTGKKKNQNEIFGFPLGYDGHVGIPTSLDVSIGAYEWFTLGIHGGALFFFNHTECMRIKTDINQTGIIKLATAKTLIEKGPIWDIGAYVKADHLGCGVSVTLGYTIVTKEEDCACAGDCAGGPTVFDPIIVNSDEQLKGWTMHNLHLLVELDLTKEGHHVGPRIGFIYNANIGGKRNFKTNMVGGAFGLDFAWTLD